MKRFKAQKTYFALVMLILGVLFIAGCAGSDQLALLEAHGVLPGACTADGPKVLLVGTTPANNAEDVPLDAKIRAVFDDEMDPATIESLNPGDQLTFTLYYMVAGVPAYISGTVTYHYILGVSYAEFAPANHLSPDQDYEAVITTHAKNVDTPPVALGCSYKWAFKTTL